MGKLFHACCASVKSFCTGFGTSVPQLIIPIDAISNRTVVNTLFIGLGQVDNKKPRGIIPLGYQELIDLQPRQ